MLNKMKARLLIGLGGLVVTSFMVMMGYTIGSQSVSNHTQKQIQSAAQKLLAKEKEKEKASVLSDELVKEFLTQYYTKEKLGENNNRIKPYMTDSAFKEEVSRQEDSINQVYKDYMLDYRFESANIYVNTEENEAFAEVSYQVGYLKDPEDRFKIIIDETVAPIVRRIFALYLDGNSYQTIARLLNEEQVITPAERKMQISQARYAKSLRLTTEQKRNVWSSNTVGQILKNEDYKGTFLFNTRTYVRGKHVFRPKSEWERIENNHEAIISSELFEQVVQLKGSKATKRKQHQIPKTSSVLTGLIRCEHCDRSLIGQYNHQGYQYFSCRYCKGQGEKMKSCRVDRIEQAIKGKLGDEAVKPHQKVSKTLVPREIERLKTEKLACFQDYKDSLLTREDYIAKKKEVDKSVQALEEHMKEANCVQLPADKKLSKEIVVAHVDKVVVDCLGFFTVIYK